MISPITSTGHSLCTECLQNISGQRNLSLKPPTSINLFAYPETGTAQSCFCHLMRSVTGYRALVSATTHTTTDAALSNSLELASFSRKCADICSKSWVLSYRLVVCYSNTKSWGWSQHQHYPLLRHSSKSLLQQVCLKHSQWWTPYIENGSSSECLFLILTRSQYLYTAKESTSSISSHFPTKPGKQKSSISRKGQREEWWHPSGRTRPKPGWVGGLGKAGHDRGIQLRKWSSSQQSQLHSLSCFHWGGHQENHIAIEKQDKGSRTNAEQPMGQIVPTGKISKLEDGTVKKNLTKRLQNTLLPLNPVYRILLKTNQVHAPKYPMSDSTKHTPILCYFVWFSTGIFHHN